MYSIINTFCSKSLQNFIVFRAQKDGSADRSWFCELYDGEATAGVKASNDVKRITVEVGSYALSIGGFHQPQPFLMKQSDLKLRRDGFMERFLLCCPFPKKMMYEEVISANDNLYGAITVQMNNHSKNYWNRFLITMILSGESTGTFIRVFLRVPVANMPEAVFCMIIMYKL